MRKILDNSKCPFTQFNYIRRHSDAPVLYYYCDGINRIVTNINPHTERQLDLTLGEQLPIFKYIKTETALRRLR